MGRISNRGILDKSFRNIFDNAKQKLKERPGWCANCRKNGMERVRYVTDQENHSIYMRCTHCGHEKNIKVSSKRKSAQSNFNSPKNGASPAQGSWIVTPLKSKLLRIDPKPKNTMAIATSEPMRNDRSNINREKSPKVIPFEPRTKTTAGILKSSKIRHLNFDMRKLATLNSTKDQSVTAWCPECKQDAQWMVTRGVNLKISLKPDCRHGERMVCSPPKRKSVRFDVESINNTATSTHGSIENERSNVDEGEFSFISPLDSALVESDLELTKTEQSGIDVRKSPIAKHKFSVESDVETSATTVVSLWPPIELLRTHLSTAQEFSIDYFLPAERDYHPCGCCLCEFSHKSKSNCVDYCIKRPIKLRKCERDAPFTKNYRKTVLCNACRLSLNDRITKKRKGGFKCSHKGCKQLHKSKSAAINHVMDHLKLRNYHCEVCSKQFKQLSALKTHERIHL